MERSGHATKKADFIELIDWQLNLLEKDPDAGKDWRQEEKRAAENEIVIR